MSYEPIDAVSSAMFSVTAFGGACWMLKATFDGFKTFGNVMSNTFGAFVMFIGLFGLFMKLMGF